MIFLRMASELSLLDSFTNNYNLWDLIIPKPDEGLIPWDEIPEDL